MDRFRLPWRRQPRRRPPAPVPDPALVSRLAPLVEDWDVYLVLQGGGARAAYQVGIYDVLHALGKEPRWVCGISMGALNAAVLAGSPPSERVARLEGFWRSIETPWDWTNAADGPAGELWKSWAASVESAVGMIGHRNFYRLRMPGSWAWPPGSAGATSYYSAAPLARNMPRWVDFGRVNDRSRPDRMQLVLGATDVAKGTLRFFDAADEPLGLDHVMAAAAMPPGSASVKIGDAQYWDGGVAGNDPMVALLGKAPVRGRRSLILLIDLWAAEGRLPRNLNEVSWRQYQIQYQSKVTSLARALEQQLGAVGVGSDRLLSGTEVSSGSRGPVSVVHLIYNATVASAPNDAVDFSANSILERRATGQADLSAALVQLEGQLSEPGDRPTILRMAGGRPVRPTEATPGS